LKIDRLYLLYRRFNIVHNKDEFLDNIDVEDLGQGLELIVALGQWTESLRDWIYPTIKKDPDYLERVLRAKGLWQNKN
jgi:hypothetical protein